MEGVTFDMENPNEQQAKEGSTSHPFAYEGNESRLNAEEDQNPVSSNQAGLDYMDANTDFELEQNANQTAEDEFNAVQNEEPQATNEADSAFLTNDEVDRDLAGLFDTEASAENFSPIRTDEKDRDTEFGAELAGNPPAAKRDSEVNTGGQTSGWIGIALAIASMFIWPAILAPSAAVLGFIAWSQGSRALGVWSIVLGIISFVAFLAIAPLYS